MSLELLEELVQAAPPRKFRDATRVPSFLEIGYGYRPGRSSGFSALLHLLAALLIASSSTRLAYVHAAEVVPPRLEPMKIDPLYLPVLGGGSEGAGREGGGSGTATEASSGLRARSHRGFTYPGPQPLVSAPPMAKIGIQTILRPNLINPPLLHQSFPLPNLAIAPPPPLAEPPKPVMKIEAGKLPIRPDEKTLQAPKLTLPTASTRNIELASAEPVMPQTLPAKPVMKIEAGTRPIGRVEKAVQAPKLTLPTASTSTLPELASAEPVMPQAAPAKPVPAAIRASDFPASTRAREGLLVLNAIPPPAETRTKIPIGEARSLFAVAPGESTIIAAPAAGTKVGGSSEASGNGVPSDNATGDAIAEIASGDGTALVAGGSGKGKGSKYGAGNGGGLEPVPADSGTGRGSAPGGNGTGGGRAEMLGSGGGAGNSPGGESFPGISIRGGTYNTAASIRAHVIKPQTSYAMTITSTASSGGGLPDYGVFQNQKVYTVYLDMRSSDDDPAPAWTLQYALLQPSDPSAIRIVGVPTPPYASLKQVPELTGELASVCAYKLIVVSGILSVNGKLEQISVKKTPDPRINAVIADALANWMFQPSQIQGNPVALKIMLGIRLTGH